MMVTCICDLRLEVDLLGSCDGWTQTLGTFLVGLQEGDLGCVNLRPLAGLLLNWALFPSFI